MKISDVLAAKGHRVVTVHPRRRVADLPKVFDDRSISSVPVVDANGRLMGLVTDRIFIQTLARVGSRMFSMSAVDIMEAPAPTCTMDTSVSEALRSMTENRWRHLVVLDVAGRMAGIVSIGDLVKFRLQDAEMESRVLREIALGHMAAQIN